MRPVLIVLREPRIQVSLQFLEPVIQLLAKCHAIKLILDGAVETLANSVGLRRVRLRLGMVDILDSQIQLVLVMFPIPAIFGTAAEGRSQACIEGSAITAVTAHSL